MTRPIAGFSLGWIFDTVPNTLCNISRFLRQSSTDAAELCLNSVRLRHLLLFWNQELETSLASFDYFSIHLPEVNWIEKDQLTREVIRCVSFLFSSSSFSFPSSCAPFKVLVVHPDTIEDWYFLARCNRDKLGGRIAIEFPMDKDKKSGKTLDELKKIYYDFPTFGFVLDVQHAYENDPTGNLAIEAAKLMGCRLRHLHVSGQKQRPEGLSRHSFLYEADNREEIQRVLAHPLLASVPRISEGEFKTCDTVAVESELACLRS